MAIPSGPNASRIMLTMTDQITITETHENDLQALRADLKFGSVTNLPAPYTPGKPQFWLRGIKKNRLATY